MCVIFAGFFVRVDSHAGRYPSDPPYLRAPSSWLASGTFAQHHADAQPLILALTCSCKGRRRCLQRRGRGWRGAHQLWLRLCSRAVPQHLCGFAIIFVVTEYGLLWGFGLPIGFACRGEAVREATQRLMSVSGPECCDRQVKLRCCARTRSQGTLSPVGDLPKVQALGARGYGPIEYRGYPTESQCALT